MAWQSEVTTINQKIQLGAESTTALGTAVAAGKSLECFDWQFTINGEVVLYNATGRKVSIHPGLERGVGRRSFRRRA